ncbi:aquaporin [Salininema proteolyticum]|uniref:Aquaporin n=1 Tax=Salininema proteolyticum TaxID=1607685 RepID=A0ABV8TX40_9ACTN
MEAKKLTAEFVGTFVLVFAGVGAVVFGIQLSGVVGVALAFGLALLAMVYAVGPVSGCHINPAVTMGMWVTGRLSIREAAGYWGAQILGGIAAAALIKLTVSAGGVMDQSTGMGANSYGVTVNLTGALIVEIALTFVLVFVVLAVTGKLGSTPVSGVAIGLTLTVVHILGIPLTGTSVNPARSIGPALFAGGEAMGQLWVFIVAPLLGGLLAAVVYPLVYGLDRSQLSEDAGPEPGQA